MIRLIPAALTDIGQVRSRNEDAFLVDAGLQLFAIADGMGGHQAGDVASRLALDTLRSSLGGSQSNVEADDALRDAILSANDRVFQESLARGHIQGMGTTLTAAWLVPQTQTLLIGHVGDSRCYRLRAGMLERLTHDHSWVQAQIDNGIIAEADAVKHPMRNVVTRSIGFEPHIEVDLIRDQPEAGDVYLLATDGLTGKISDRELQALLPELLANRDLEHVLAQLVADANARGGEDNITVVVVKAEA